ncbi:MAG: DnaA regulatory inactivator Hda [Burkholderiales bacterium]
MEQLVLDLAPFSAQTFANFIPGRNTEALRALIEVCAGRTKSLIYLWGVKGAGKSHLLNAAVSEVLGCGGAARHFEGGCFYDLSRCDLAVADAAETLDEDAQSALFSVYNDRRDSGLPLLIAGSMPPAQMRLRADLRSRLAWGLVFEVHVLSDEEKAAALESRALTRGFRVSREVVQYLLSREQRDLPTLFATLDALDRYSLQTRRAITVATLRELLRQALSRE